MGALLEKIDTLEKVADLYLKGYKNTEIARELAISPAQAKHYIQQYKEAISTRVMEDPDFLERLQENTLESLERHDMLIKETWLVLETAKNNELINQIINAIKLASELEGNRAKLLQLMGAKVDSGMTARINKAEQVNSIISRILKDIVADCDHCKIPVMSRMAEAFALMNQADQAVDIVQEFDDDIVDAEIIVEEDVDEAILADVLTIE